MTKTITVYGPGCKKCKVLKENTERALENIGSSIDLEYVTDIGAIAEAGIMSTPALAVDGKIVSAGKVLKPADIEKYL